MISILLLFSLMLSTVSVVTICHHTTPLTIFPVLDFSPPDFFILHPRVCMSPILEVRNYIQLWSNLKTGTDVYLWVLFPKDLNYIFLNCGKYRKAKRKWKLFFLTPPRENATNIMRRLSNLLYVYIIYAIHI